MKKESAFQRLKWIAAVLAGVALAFLVLLSVQEKHGVDLGLPKLTLPGSEFVDALFTENRDESGVPAMAQADGVSANAELKVHFIDVGQGKSILIQGPEKKVLIDAGENDQGQKVLRYLAAERVSSLDIVIGTHPHSDHIGGLDTVIDGITVYKLILPIVAEAAVPTTGTYTDLLHAVKSSNLKITPAKSGSVFDLGGGAKLTILGPLKPYEDLNDASVVTRLDYGETSFLFTGDATKNAEQDMLDAGINVSAHVLDVGHHGSTTSSSENFMRAVGPKISVISCGLDNQHKHPSREVMVRLKELCGQIARTDLDGTVIVFSDGKTLSVETEK